MEEPKTLTEEEQIQQAARIEAATNGLAEILADLGIGG